MVARSVLEEPKSPQSRNEKLENKEDIPKQEVERVDGLDELVKNGPLGQKEAPESGGSDKSKVVGLLEAMLAILK